MTDLAYPTTGRMSASSMLRCVVVVLVLATLLPLGRAADDPYLKMFDKEVTKVEAGMQIGSTRGEAAETASSREHFERMLRQKHVGTYSFYRRLPPRSREQVFLDYRNGAPMEVLRGKIIDRFLHP